MYQISHYEIIEYQVKIAGKNVKKFYTEEEALAYINNNISAFIYMRKISNAMLYKSNEILPPDEDA